MSHYAALRQAVALALPITLGAWAVQAADIIQTAEHDGRFNGFLQLLEAAGMIEVLEGEGPFTVFAPVDEAFGQLPPGVLEWLLAEENGNVLETITAIVVEAPQDAVAGAELSMVPTGQELTAAAMVVEPDIEADNGIIHGIDLVLLPPEPLRSF